LRQFFPVGQGFGFMLYLELELLF